MSNSNSPSAEQIMSYMQRIVSDETQHSNVDLDKPFKELGLDSINSIYLLEKVENQFSVKLTPLYFWDYPTIRLLAGQIHKENFE